MNPSNQLINEGKNMNNLEKTYCFFNEVNLENGSNYKIAVLEKYNNVLLQRILKMTYDRVAFVYGVSLKSVLNAENDLGCETTLEKSLDLLEKLSKREFTGNQALRIAKIHMESLPEQDAEIFKGIIDRDLKINMGTSLINRVIKGLIKKPVYMRCATYSDKTAKKIKYPAIVQLKSDGTYREFTVKDGLVQSMSRSGEPYDYPILNEQMKDLPNGVYVGELVLRASKWLLESLPASQKIDELQDKFTQNPNLILPREIGNGLINSDTPPHNNIVLELWDYITLDEYKMASNKEKCKIQYKDRFEAVKQIKADNIQCIHFEIVENLKEALEFTSKCMQSGFEGSVLKNLNAVFRDGTSPDQLKLKLEIEADVRITGFTEGTGKNADYFGAITFKNDEGTIEGKVGVSSMTEKLRDWIHENRENVIGKVMEVQFNDISRARDSKTYSLTHPRFIELRSDKDETDTYQRVLEMREMATNLS